MGERRTQITVVVEAVAESSKKRGGEVEGRGGKLIWEAMGLMTELSTLWGSGPN
jgi:hypothetical protein